MLYELFTNHLEFLALEFLLALLILTILPFFVFLVTTKKNIKENIKKTINSIVLYLLIIFSYNLINTSCIISNLMNGCFFFDDFSKLIKILILFFLFTYLLITKNCNKLIKFENIILILISTLGLLLLVSSYNFIIMYLSIELQSLCFYILITSENKSPFSSEAALKYFILGAIASSFILFGSSIIYLITGSINFGTIKCILNGINKVNNLEIVLSIFYGLFFILIGLLFKIGSAPFHLWLPDVYEGSPVNITTFFAIVPKIAILSILIILFFNIFNDIFEFFKSIFYVCSLFSILIGSFATLQQKKIKRLLAYSSIGHVGFILIGFVSNSLFDLQNILFYIIIYTIMTINFWTILLSFKINKNFIKYITDFSSFSKLNLTLSFIIILNLFSMAGIPPLAGFFSKMFIFYSALNSKIIGLSVLGILISSISAFYYIRIIKIIFFDILFENKILNQITKENSFIILINSGIIFFFFLFPEYLLTYLEKISLLFFI